MRLFAFLACISLICAGCLKAQPADSTHAPHYINISPGALPDFLKPHTDFKPMISAHRGGRFLQGYPENCLETFEHLLNYAPAIIECDIRMSKDSVLLLLHDKSLDRTTTATGPVNEWMMEQLEHLFLLDDFGNETEFHIPTLKQTLEWAKGKAILSLDVKRGPSFEKVIELVHETETEDYAIIIAYSVEDAQLIHRLAPDLMISVTARNEEEWQRLQKSGIPHNRMVAFTGTKLSSPQHYRSLRKAGILSIVGTIGNLDRKAASRGEQIYREIIRRGSHIIATDRPIEAAQALQKL